MSNHDIFLRRQIESAMPGLWDILDRLDSLQPDIGIRALKIILEFACISQHIGAIRAGKTAFEKIPKEWLAIHLHEAVAQTLDLTDEWSYRRLLELLVDSMPNMLKIYEDVGMASASVEIVCAANDFRSRNR